MRIVDAELRLSATDLANHLACRHLTSLDLVCARGETDPPAWANPFTAVLRELGLEHETAYLNHLKQTGRSVVELQPQAADSSSALEETAEAMKAGPDVIYQPTLGLGGWIGRADVLLRKDAPSDLGTWSYEVVDCKLARSTRAGTILQLALYSECVKEVQGLRPEQMYVLTPGAEFAPIPFRTADYSAYYRSVVQRLLEAVRDQPPTYPEPTAHCDICQWWRSCEARRREDDHLCFVAGISKLQTEQLREWDVTTLDRLSKMAVPLSQSPRRGASEGYVRIREQARAQVQARESEVPVSESLPAEPGKGLARLPEPSPGDVFLDLEGDRFVDETGLEYLFGLAGASEDGSVAYERRWAFDRDGEKAAFEWTIDEIGERLERFPGAHVYHFGHYEATALKRLMGQYVTREEEIDQMLRGGVFVDLHSVVRQSLRAGIEEYSLKELEQFHSYDRETPLKDASVCKRVIERALELSAVERIEEGTKRTVESYNRDDCLSALRLRDWLESLRTESIQRGVEIPRPVFESGDPSEALDERQQDIQRLVGLLTEDVPTAVAERSPEQHARWLLAYLLDYHRRESKSSWWEFFRLLGLEQEAFAEDRSAIAGLTYEEHLGGTARCPIHGYSFPRQETDVRSGAALLVGKLSEDGGQDAERVGTVESIDLATGKISIKKTQAMKSAHPTSAFADPRFGGYSDPRPDALRSIAQWVVENGIDREGPYAAARSVLLQRCPSLSGDLSCEAIQDGCDSALEAAKTLSLALQNSVLPIQGPPGSGKTYTGARIICELVRAGRKVGVTALGHKAIANLLNETLEAASEEGLDLRCIRKVTDADSESPDEIIQTKKNDEPLAALNRGDAQVAAGTAWLWARDDYQASIDVLVVDEAGQMPLADVLAVSRAAGSLILLGDPAQLEQPQQGSHPEGIAVSALQHLLGEGRRTITKERGLFLPETWRLHPSICQFTSEVFYESKLESHSGLDQQALVGASPFEGAGLWFVPVEHRANQNASEEEVDAVTRIVDSLLASGIEWTDSGGNRQALELSDILVVAPYNAQVSDLLARLPEGARVGTVDKFQGQQAPIVVYSMTTSSPEDAPRGMEFLYSLNRLNVATSRARCASILVASERLLEPECRTPRQMKLANALCRYVELAKTVRVDEMARRQAAGAGAGNGS